MGTRVLTIRREPSSLIYEGTRKNAKEEKERKNERVWVSVHVTWLLPSSSLPSLFVLFRVPSGQIRSSISL